MNINISEHTNVLLTREIPDANKEQWYRFTFGCGQKHAGHFVKFYGTFSEAREQMCKKYGTDWCFQYSEKEWQDNIERAKGQYEVETELVDSE